MPEKKVHDENYVRHGHHPIAGDVPPGKRIGRGLAFEQVIDQEYYVPDVYHAACVGIPPVFHDIYHKGVLRHRTEGVSGYIWPSG